MAFVTCITWHKIYILSCTVLQSYQSPLAISGHTTFRKIKIVYSYKPNRAVEQRVLMFDTPKNGVIYIEAYNTAKSFR